MDLRHILKVALKPLGRVFCLYFCIKVDIAVIAMSYILSKSISIDKYLIKTGNIVGM